MEVFLVWLLIHSIQSQAIHRFLIVFLPGVCAQVCEGGTISFWMRVPEPKTKSSVWNTHIRNSVQVSYNAFKIKRCGTSFESWESMSKPCGSQKLLLNVGKMFQKWSRLPYRLLCHKGNKNLPENLLNLSVALPGFGWVFSAWRSWIGPRGQIWLWNINRFPMLRRTQHYH